MQSIRNIHFFCTNRAAYLRGELPPGATRTKILIESIFFSFLKAGGIVCLVLYLRYPDLIASAVHKPNIFILGVALLGVGGGATFLNAITSTPFFLRLLRDRKVQKLDRTVETLDAEPTVEESSKINRKIKKLTNEFAEVLQDSNKPLSGIVFNVNSTLAYVEANLTEDNESDVASLIEEMQKNLNSVAEKELNTIKRMDRTSEINFVTDALLKVIEFKKEYLENTDLDKSSLELVNKLLNKLAKEWKGNLWTQIGIPLQTRYQQLRGEIQ